MIHREKERFLHGEDGEIRVADAKLLHVQCEWTNRKMTYKRTSSKVKKKKNPQPMRRRKEKTSFSIIDSAEKEVFMYRFLIAVGLRIEATNIFRRNGMKNTAFVIRESLLQRLLDTAAVFTAGKCH